MRAETSARLFRLLHEVLHRFVDDGHTCTFRDGITRADEARGPRIVTLQHGSRRERNERVHERELVMEFPNAYQALAHQPDRFIGLPSTHRQGRAHVKGPGEEPWTRVSEY